MTVKEFKVWLEGFLEGCNKEPLNLDGEEIEIVLKKISTLRDSSKQDVQSPSIKELEELIRKPYESPSYNPDMPQWSIPFGLETCGDTM